MIRLPLALLTVPLLTGCAAMPGLDHPLIELTPQLNLLRVTGTTSLASDDGAGAITANPTIDTEQFGLGDRDEDVAGMISIGDGFSGFDLAYQKIDQKTSNQGVLPAAWGALQQGDQVNTKLFMDEFRLRYTAGLLDLENDDELRLRAGPGLVLAHRELDIQVREDQGRTQNLAIKDDGVLYASARVRVDFAPFALQADVAVSPDVRFGGDFKGTMTDLEVMGSYRFEDQDLVVFVGYRRSDLDAEGTLGEAPWRADLTLDGYLFGLRFTF